MYSTKQPCTYSAVTANDQVLMYSCIHWLDRRKELRICLCPVPPKLCPMPYYPGFMVLALNLDQLNIRVVLYDLLYIEVLKQTWI